MSKQGYIVRAMSSWFLAACCLAVGVAALVAAPQPFVQQVFAQSGCTPDQPGACGKQFCCGGVCQDCCADGDCGPNTYCCNGTCSNCPCDEDD